MTKEEAIADIRDNIKPVVGGKSLDMAIEALEQQPCEDCISRAEVLKLLEKEDWADTVYGVMALPSVTPQQEIGHWIEDAITYYEELNKRGLGVDEYTPYFTDDIACSECLAKYSVIDNETQFFKYCPNCGAKMEVDDADSN